MDSSSTLHKRGGPEVSARSFSSNHREQLERSALAGCFYCEGVFDPKTIKEWVDDESTALCPACGIDSVVGDASGYPVTDVQFLASMHKVWF